MSSSECESESDRSSSGGSGTDEEGEEHSSNQASASDDDESGSGSEQQSGNDDDESGSDESGSGDDSGEEGGSECDSDDSDESGSGESGSGSEESGSGSGSEEEEEEDGSEADDSATFSDATSSSEEIGSEASASDDSGEEAEDEEDGSDASEESDISTGERRRRRRKPLTAAQQAELKAMRHSLKSMKKQTFKRETIVDPPFFSYLTLMHDWHNLDLPAQRKTLRDEKAAELRQSLYDPRDGVPDGTKSVWDAIQAEVDALPVSRRLSSPLRFRRLAELAMEMEHTGRMRRMIAMERSILHTVLHILRAANGKIIPPAPRTSTDFAAETPIRELMGDEHTDDELALPIAAAAASSHSHAHPTRSTRSNSRQGSHHVPECIPEDEDEEMMAEQKRGHASSSHHHEVHFAPDDDHAAAAAAHHSGAWTDALPLRTRSSLRRSSLKAARPTTFTNIPPKSSRRRTRATDKAALPPPPPPSSAAYHLALPVQPARPSSAPPADLTLVLTTPPQPRGRKRRAPDSNETAATQNSTRTLPLPVTRNNRASSPAPLGQRTRSATLVLPQPRLVFHRHQSVPPGGSNGFPSSSPIFGASLHVPLHPFTGFVGVGATSSTQTSPQRMLKTKATGRRSATVARRTASSPLPNLSSWPGNPHAAWIGTLIRHRDDLHLFLAGVLFMAFVHTTDSEKLATFKRQMLTALLHHAGWGKQAIQKQMQKMLRVPTVATGSTSGAAAFSQTATPITPSHALHMASRQKSVTHTLHPNSNMIFKFDAVCLDLIGRDLLPQLSERVPGEAEAQDIINESADSMDEVATSEVYSRSERKHAEEDEEVDADESMESEEEQESGGEDEEIVSGEESDYRRARRAPPVKRPPRRRKGKASKAKGKPAQSTRKLRSQGVASDSASVLTASSKENRSPALQAMSAKPPSTAAVTKPSRTQHGHGHAHAHAHAARVPPLAPFHNDVRSPAGAAASASSANTASLTPELAHRSTPSSNSGASPRWSTQLATWVTGASQSVMQTLGWNNGRNNATTAASDRTRAQSSSFSLTSSVTSVAFTVPAAAIVTPKAIALRNNRPIKKAKTSHRVATQEDEGEDQPAAAYSTQPVPAAARRVTRTTAAAARSPPPRPRASRTAASASSAPPKPRRSTRNRT